MLITALLLDGQLVKYEYKGIFQEAVDDGSWCQVH